MRWEEFAAASLLSDLYSVDGVINDKPAWQAFVGEQQAIVYHCQEGGFGVNIWDGQDYDGTWGETLSEAKANAEQILELPL